MNISIRSVLLSGLVLAASSGVSADEPYKWYAAFGGGATFLNDNGTTQAGIAITSEFDTGGALFGSVGAIFGNFRAEGELFSSYNEVTALTGNGITISADGDFATVALMLNGYFDIATGSKWRPYLGGGIGFANISYNDIVLRGVLVTDDDDTVFAYQGRVGIAYSFSPHWDGTLGYHYFGTADAGFVDSTGFAFDADGVQMHVIEIGARFRW